MLHWVSLLVLRRRRGVKKEGVVPLELPLLLVASVSSFVLSTGRPWLGHLCSLLCLLICRDECGLWLTVLNQRVFLLEVILSLVSSVVKVIAV